MGEAFKIAAELIAGIAVGGGIGWALDRAFGTRWLFPLFLVLGIAGGMSNVIKSARKMQAAAEPMQRASPSVPDDDGDDAERPVSLPRDGTPKPDGSRKG